MIGKTALKVQGAIGFARDVLLRLAAGFDLAEIFGVIAIFGEDADFVPKGGVLGNIGVLLVLDTIAMLTFPGFAKF